MIQLRELTITAPGLRGVSLDAWQRTDRTHHLVQIALLALSALAIYLVALPDGHPLREWGYPIGFAAQPFWFWSAWRARQVGIFMLTFFYTGVWTTGVVRHFF